jgi:hypothetical protein
MASFMTENAEWWDSESAELSVRLLAEKPAAMKTDPIGVNMSQVEGSGLAIVVVVFSA